MSARLKAALFALALSGVVLPARAEPGERQTCLDSAERGQQLLRARQLLEARDELAICTGEVCPGMVRRDCIGWLLEVDSALPTIVLRAVDETGHDVLQGTVTVDDKPAPQALEGKPIALDPGPHTLRLVSSDRTASETFVARESEKERAISLRLRAPAEARTLERAPAPSAVATSTYILAAVSIAATGAFAYFGTKGISERARSCDEAHTCDHSAYNTITTDYAVATVALGIAVLSFGGALWTYLARGAAHDPRPSSASPVHF